MKNTPNALFDLQPIAPLPFSPLTIPDGMLFAEIPPGHFTIRVDRARGLAGEQIIRGDLLLVRRQSRVSSSHLAVVETWDPRWMYLPSDRAAAYVHRLGGTTRLRYNEKGVRSQTFNARDVVVLGRVVGVYREYTAAEIAEAKRAARG